MKDIRKLGIAILSCFIVMALSCMVACMPSDKDMKEEIEKLNKEMPQDLGDGMTMEKIDFNSDGFVYIIKCNEEYINIDLIKENKDAIKAAMLENLRQSAASDEEVKALVDYCKKADKTISYHFIGATSGSSETIMALPSEM